MNKRDLIVRASENTGHPQVLIESIFDELEKIIAEELAKKRNSFNIRFWNIFYY